MKASLTPRQVLGIKGEAIAVTFALSHTWIIVEQNVRVDSGEIDLVAKEGEEWVFIEVRTKSTKAYGSPAESLTLRKRARMARCAFDYLRRKDLNPDTTLWRVDFVGVTLERGSLPTIEYVKHVLE